MSQIETFSLERERLMLEGKLMPGPVPSYTRFDREDIGFPMRIEDFEAAAREITTASFTEIEFNFAEFNRRNFIDV